LDTVARFEIDTFKMINIFEFYDDKKYGK